MNPILRLAEVSKIYPGHKTAVVNKLSLELTKGEIFGLIGPNGAGKTTTVSMCSGLLATSGGSIFLQDQELYRRKRNWRHLIGVVPQDIALYPTLTGRENLAFFGRLFGLSNSELNQRIEILLKQLGLTAAADRRLETYSGGMKRRLNLLAALIKQPALLFLDEPTVGVDVQSRTVILDFLRELNQQGTSIFYTSHYLEEAEQLCQRVAIMDKGQVIASGTPRQLVAGHPGATGLTDVFINLTGRQIRD